VTLIGIAGGSGSGKTTFAKKIMKRVSDRVALVHMDSYYLAEQLEENICPKGKANFDHPQAFDWELLLEHLSMLKAGKTIHSPIYDFKTSSRTTSTTPIEPADVIMFEGIFALYSKELRDMLDICIFLHVDADIRFTRRLNRDVKERSRSLDSVIEQYYETVRPMHMKYLEPQKQHAHLIVGEETDIAASVVSAKVNEILFPRNLGTAQSPIEHH
jgi:uridine kinase